MPTHPRADAPACRRTDPNLDDFARRVGYLTHHGRCGACWCRGEAHAVPQRCLMARAGVHAPHLPSVQAMPDSTSHAVRRIRSCQLNVEFRRTRVMVWRTLQRRPLKRPVSHIDEQVCCRTQVSAVKDRQPPMQCRPAVGRTSCLPSGPASWQLKAQPQVPYCVRGGRRHAPHHSSGASRRAHPDRFPNTITTDLSNQPPRRLWVWTACTTLCRPCCVAPTPARSSVQAWPIN